MSDRREELKSNVDQIDAAFEEALKRAVKDLMDEDVKSFLELAKEDEKDDNSP